LPLNREALILPHFNETDEPFSAATTATFGGPRQMPEDIGEDEEDDFGFNPKTSAAQPLVRKSSNLSRNNSTHSTSSNRVPTNSRRSWPPSTAASSSQQNVNDRAKSDEQ